MGHRHSARPWRRFAQAPCAGGPNMPSFAAEEQGDSWRVQNGV